MKRIIFFSIFLLVIFFLGCNNGANNPSQPNEMEDTPATVENKIMVPATVCYSGIRRKDSFYLKVENFPHVVTGKLTYKFYEKDKATGDIDGKMSGDTLVAYYHFMSEGKQSVRQVLFLIKDSTATEGTGLMEEKNGKTVFKDLDTVNFENGVQLKRIACPAE